MEDSHCCSIETVTVTSQTSNATASRCFPVTTVFSEVHLDITAPTFNYIGQEILYLFDSRSAMVQPLLLRKMRDKVCDFMTLPDKSSANAVAQSLLSIIDSTQDQLENNFLTVDKEIQFNDWLFVKLDCLLSPQGFVVRQNKPNKEILPNVCEYSTSQPDCVVYHTNSLLGNQVIASIIQIEGDNSSESEDSIVNIDDMDDFTLTTSSGFAIEIKSDLVSEAAINECYYNMFGAGSRLATMQLEMGNVVESVKMYGVVVSMQDPNHAVLLSVKIDFASNTCDFRRVDKKYSFIELMNLILTHLAV